MTETELTMLESIARETKKQLRLAPTTSYWVGTCRERCEEILILVDEVRRLKEQMALGRDQYDA